VRFERYLRAQSRVASHLLNLTPQQESQLAPILRAEKPKVQAIMQTRICRPRRRKRNNNTYTRRLIRL
jgi:hypothetical protein